MAGDWRITADERIRYESYFQQCGPTQGYLTGEQARDFFVKSTLSGDILRKIWDLADVTSDGRLDSREFTIACHLIASQVQHKGPLPSTLPPSLLSDSGITTNGIPSITTPPLSINPSSQQDQPTGHILKTIGPNTPSIIPLTPTIRSKYLQQFHSLVDVTKTNGFMTGLQAKTILQQTGLSNILLHQIWNLADHDKDGRLTSDEFIVAMHCCDIARTGQTLPAYLPDEWLTQRERLDSSSKSNDNQIHPNINPPKPPETTAAEAAEAERKIAATYEERRLKNIEDGNRELERRRQLLREQEEREQKERDERERKREFELQKQKDEQERKKQIEIEKQLEKQRQIEQQKEEERKKLYEQREAARKEMERKSRLEWERQRMQELSTQKSRLNDQINDLKSRGKGFELELENIDDTMQTFQTKITQIETNIHATDETIADIQRNIMTERNLYENIEQQKKDFTVQLNTTQAERESLDSSVYQLNQSKEFSNANREADQIKFLQAQMENMKQESTQIDEQMTTITDQCKEYQNQMEQLRLQFYQFEKEAKDQKPPSKATSPTNPPAEFANFDQFNANMPSNDENNQPSHLYPSLPVVPTSASPPPDATVHVDPFQTVDPFASQSDIGSTTANNDWFQPTNNDNTTTTVDPFVPKPEPPQDLPVVASPKPKKAAPKANPNLKDAPKPPPAADPWGGSTTNNDGNSWAKFGSNGTTNSSFGATPEWPQPTTVSDEQSSTETIQYRVLFDYIPERPDEMAILTGDIITCDPNQVHPSRQQDEHWLFGQIGNDKQGFFPAAYAERITSTPSANVVDTTSQLVSGSWVMSLAECQGKTVDKHLSFQKSELIHVREQKDAIWYSGQLHGKIGWFPRNYVRPATEAEIGNKENSPKITPTNEKPLDVPASSSNGEPANTVDNADIYEAIYSYEATESSDLSFEAGQHIVVLKRDGDWWTGQIGDRIGAFPNNYVQKVENIQETAIAITSFQTTEEGYLSFESGQMIYITKKDETGLYQGEIRLPDQSVRVGWFPAECAQIQPAVTPSAPLELQQYIAIFPYEAQQDDELSFPADAVLEILDQTNPNGWFKARLGHQIGLIPSTYVQPIDAQTQSTSTPSHLSPNIIPCTPTTANSSQPPFYDESTVTSGYDSSTLITDTSSQQISNNSSRISAIKELIETEQRYIKDLRTVAEKFIKPLSNGRILNDYEIEQLFSNWFSLIACNTIFLSTLQEQVQYKEHILPPENEFFIGTPRSASMSNIARSAQSPVKSFIDNHQRLITPELFHSPPVQRIKYRDRTLRRRQNPSVNNSTINRPMSIERLDDNIVPQSIHPSSSSSMTIDDSTRIGDILCSYLPYMADAYFQYCNCRSKADKYLQSKIDLNKQFESQLNTFQHKTGGLSLNGFLTKPIQRVTRYPLLIEKILKHTSINHPDYQSIQQAYECARQLNERINKQICEQENSLRLDWLQQYITFTTDENSTDGYIFDELLIFNSITKFHIQRQLLLHGFIVKVSSGRELLAFLFNDFLLFTTMKTSTNRWQSQLFESKSNLQLKIYRLPLFLTDIIIANETVNDKLTFSILAKNNHKQLVLKTQQTNLRTLWVRAINNAVEECQAAEKSIAAEKALFAITDESKSAVAHLILVVQEAHGLISSMTTPERPRTVNPYCEITVGSLTLKTPFLKRTNNPKWDVSMQFSLYNLVEDIIHINIFDNAFFSPNENIGYTSVHLRDILPCPLETFLTQSSHTFTQTIYLNNGASVVMKCTVEFL